MKILTFILLSVVSATVLAHSGHGESSAMAHELEHSIWLTLGLVLLASIAGWAMIKKR